MIKRGAKKLVLNSRRGLTNSFQTYCLHKWTEYKDVSVQVNTADISIEAAAQTLISDAKRLGPVGGKKCLNIV